MTTPLVTVANSIIEFILSLLRDPAALAELQEDPEAALVKNKVAGICADDVRAVAPIIYDRPDVVPRSTPPMSPTPSTHSNANDVLNEITRITNNWTTIDNRSTIVDQSVNQNIWTEGGDVTQIFDQSAGVASGDGSVAAGDDYTVGPNPGDEAGEDPTLADLPGMPDEAAELGGLGELDELGDGGTEPPTDGEQAPPTADQPAEQIAAAQDAGVPPEAVAVVDDAVGDAASTAEQPPAPAAYEAPVAEVDEAVWSEPVDAVEVEEVAYPDELGEEQ